MSYAQFGYSYHPASQILVGGQTGSTSVAPNPCCESGRAMVTDPVTGQAVFSCQQCDSHSLVYPRLGSSVPTSPYAPYSEQNYPAVGMESPTFYSSLGTPYVLKEGSSEVPGWQSMAQPTGYYPYDPSLAAYGYGYDLNGARRKNATREATTTLKTWLNDHKKNPYPTKGEKIMLAIITKMTLTQVSTWFANARRRLKKENKITWSSKGKDDEDDDDGKLSDADDDKDSSSDRLDGSSNDGTPNKVSDTVFDKSVDGKDMVSYDKDSGCNPLLPGATSSMNRLPCDPSSAAISATSSPVLHMPHQLHAHQALSRYPLDMQTQQRLKSCSDMDKDILQSGNLHSDPSIDTGVSPLSQNKPKIWSLADTATCKTPTTSSMALGVGGGLGGPPRPSCLTMTTGAAMIPNWTPAVTPNQRRPVGLSHSLPPFQVTSSGSSYGNPYHSGSSGMSLSSLPQTKSTSLAVPHPTAGMVSNSGCDGVNPSSIMTGRTSGGGQCSSNTFSELQTDTPPQTPPNHKFPSVPHYAHHATVSVPQGPSYNTSEHYVGGQRTLLSSVNARLNEFQDDSSDVNYTANQQPLANNGTAQPSGGTAFKPVYKRSLMFQTSNIQRNIMLNNFYE